MRRDDLSVQLPAILLYLCSTNSRIGAPNNHVTPYEKALWRQEVTSSSTRLRGGHQPRPVWVRGGRRDILNVRRAKVKTRRVTLTIGKSANGELHPHHSHNKNDPSIHPFAVSGSRPDFHTLRGVQRRDPIWSIHSSQTSCLETINPPTLQSKMAAVGVQHPPPLAMSPSANKS